MWYRVWRVLQVWGVQFHIESLWKATEWCCCQLLQKCSMIPITALWCGSELTCSTLQHWPVFKEVTEVFILVPALLGLKGNLEMTLASRLSTAVRPLCVLLLLKLIWGSQLSSQMILAFSFFSHTFTKTPQFSIFHSPSLNTLCRMFCCTIVAAICPCVKCFNLSHRLTLVVKTDCSWSQRSRCRMWPRFRANWLRHSPFLCLESSQGLLQQLLTYLSVLVWIYLDGTCCCIAVNNKA